MRSGNNVTAHNRRSNRLIFAGCLVILAAVAIPLYTVNSASMRSRGNAARNISANSNQVVLPSPKLRPGVGFMSAPPASIALQTFAAPGCTVPKTSFDLGESVCVQVTGAPQPSGGIATSRIGWVSPYGSLTQGATITTDPQTGTYNIPSTATQTFTDDGGGTVTVDNRGVWTVGVYAASDGSQVATTDFTVHDPAKAFVDLSVHQSLTVSESQVDAGSGSEFKIFISNRGPDAAQNIVLTDTIPANVSFFSATEDSPQLGFNCGNESGGVFSCTLGSMPAGATAVISFAYTVAGGTPEGTLLTNSVTISSDDAPCANPTPAAPCEIQPEDNTSTATAKVPFSTPGDTCTIQCQENFSVVANTTQGAESGAFVTFSAGSVFGSCGAITTNPASGTFFSVGTHTVNVTSEIGNGSCSFTISVVEGTPPTITCPPNVTGTDDGSGSATFTAAQIGTPTTNPATGVTVTFERSDDIDATYDGNGNVVTPPVVHSLTDPYSTGSTGITWTVKDANGLTASCTQTVLVHPPCASDSQPPTVTAPPDVTRNTGPGSTTCGVVLNTELGQPTATDDCGATVTRTGVPPGDLFPVGVTTITYTATDGAGHTATATQKVTVTDNTPPVIFAPADANYTCPEQVPALNASQAFGPDFTDDNVNNPGPPFDNCGVPAVSASQTTSGVGSLANPLIITRTYTALDSHGNSSSAVQVITVTDGTPPSITAPADVTAFTGPGATTCDALVNVGTATASDNCAGVVITRSPAGNTFPVGTTTVTWTATDWAGNTSTATQQVTVVDNTPPVITTNGVTPSMWPPNHRYQTFQLTGFVTGASDNCGGVSISNVVIESVTSDEIENGNGDGNTTNDIVIAADCRSVQLRAEREGNSDGRVYTITFKVTDTHGNVGTATAKVVVPHNPGETPVDSGVHYAVNGTCP